MSENSISNRVVVYLQTFKNMNLLPACYPNLTAINLASFHFGCESETNTPYIHLNDNLPNDPIFDGLWLEMQQAQSNGVLLIAMLGGVGGAYTDLFNDYDTLYPMWVSMLRQYNFNGIDLNVQEPVSQKNIQKLLLDLRKDFGFFDFKITITVDPNAILNQLDPISGINWIPLVHTIDWLNVKFYQMLTGLNTLENYVSEYRQLGIERTQIVFGAHTFSHIPDGQPPISQVVKTLNSLHQRYLFEMGGTSGWEFWNAMDSKGNINPPEWASLMANAVGKKG